MLQRKVCSITLILVWLPLASVMLAVQVSAQEAQTVVGAEIKGLAPVSQEILQVELPKAAEIQLDNGLRLMVLEDHRVPLVSFQIILIGAGGLRSARPSWPGQFHCFLTNRRNNYAYFCRECSSA